MPDKLKMLSYDLFRGKPKKLVQAQGLYHVFRLLNWDVIFDLTCLTPEEIQEFKQFCEVYKFYNDEMDLADGVHYVRNKLGKYVDDSDWGDELEKLSVPVLEEMALAVYALKNWKPCDAWWLGGEYPKGRREIRELLDDIMRVRWHKLNEEFEFTQENVDALLKLNADLVRVHCAAREELRARVPELQKRLDDKDVFLTDYEMDACITPYMDYPDGEDDTIADIFCDDAERNSVFMRLDKRNILRPDDCAEDVLHRFSAGTEGDITFFLWGEKLKDYKFCYAMHELFEHYHFRYSFSDLLKIKSFWIDINVQYQRQEEISV